MAFPNQITPEPQAGAPAIVNENFQTLAHQAVFGKNAATTTGLVWGYFGGRWGGFTVADGTLTLTASVANYLVVAIATGVISASTATTNWNNPTSYARVYKITPGVASIADSGIEDHRAGPGGVHGGAAAGGSTFTGGTLTSALNEAPKVTIASAASVAIGAATSNAVTITGSTTITSFDTIADGAVREVTFSGALTLTHNATTLILPTGASIVTAAGDVAYFRSLGGGNWRCVGYQRASGAALNASSFTGGTLASALNEAPTVTIASSTTPAIFAASGNTVSMTGTTTVTGFDTIAAGAVRRVVFTGALQLTHNATSMINVTGANITTAAGDVAEFLSLGSGNTRMLSYTRTNGQALGVATQSVVFQLALSDLTTAIATGTGVGYFDAPYAFTITEVIATVLTASSSGLPQFNVKKNGTTVLSTNITIDATETSSLTAATPPVISVTSVAKGDRISWDIVAAGTGAKGAQGTIVGTKP